MWMILPPPAARIRGHPHGLRQQQRGAEVFTRTTRVEVVRRDLAEGLAQPDARVVHQHVDPADRGRRRRHDRRSRSREGEIGRCPTRCGGVRVLRRHSAAAASSASRVPVGHEVDREPGRASASAQARPMPREAPVTMAPRTAVTPPARSRGKARASARRPR